MWSVGWSGVKHAAIGLWGSGNAFSGVNHASTSGCPMNESGFGGCQENAIPAPMHSANCKVWWRRNNGLGLFFMVWARPLRSSEWKYECYSIQWHSRQFCASNFVGFNCLWKAFFCFSKTMPPVHKARSTQKWFVKICVEELDWPLNPLWTPLWLIGSPLMLLRLSQQQCSNI